MSTTRLPLAVIALSSMALAQSSAKSPFLTDAEIRVMLVERIDREHRGVGIAVGVIDVDGRRVLAHGTLGKGDARPVTGDTIFEIGSVTKVFTALVLSEMVQRGKVELTDPIQKFLPEKHNGKDVTAPERAGRKITLVDLATHTSGLPRLPHNLGMKDFANPYANYSVDRLYEFLSEYQLPRDVGSRYEYSNLGGGLLGHLLARRAGMEYEELIRSLICKPLDMKSTAITLTPEMKERFATGHNDKLAVVPPWDFASLQGAGALRSTANDLLKFLAANIGYTKSKLTDAMKAMFETRRETGQPGLGIVLGWHIAKRGAEELVWHNGGTGGYRAFIGYSPKHRRGIAIVSNTSITVDDLGLRLLNPAAPAK
jgi:CubicO group peptidase (beta-lactamase class C family)